VPWALSRLDIERVLKGPQRRRHVTLIGPSPASKHLPRAPALRAGIHAVFLLQRPPEEAMSHVPNGERQSAGFIAETSDIQPTDLATYEVVCAAFLAVAALASWLPARSAAGIDPLITMRSD
jgi:hypothetical protein